MNKNLWPFIVLLLGATFLIILNNYWMKKVKVDAWAKRADCVITMDKDGIDRFPACTDIMDAGR